MHRARNLSARWVFPDSYAKFGFVNASADELQLKPIP
jgi:hypothetical protein